MEEVKKVRRPPDPNSAKYKLGQIAAKAYSDVAEAKARGEKIGWISSNFPVEIPETLGIPVCYPEREAVPGGGGRGLFQRHLRLRPDQPGLRQERQCPRAGYAPAGLRALLQ